MSKQPQTGVRSGELAKQRLCGKVVGPGGVPNIVEHADVLRPNRGLILVRLFLQRYALEWRATPDGMIVRAVLPGSSRAQVLNAVVCPKAVDVVKQNGQLAVMHQPDNVMGLIVLTDNRNLSIPVALDGACNGAGFRAAPCDAVKDRAVLQAVDVQAMRELCGQISGKILSSASQIAIGNLQAERLHNIANNTLSQTKLARDLRAVTPCLHHRRDLRRASVRCAGRACLARSHGLGGLLAQHGPVNAGAKLFASNLPAGFPLNSNRQSSAARLLPVHHISHVADGCSAPDGEFGTRILIRERLKKGFEFHALDYTRWCARCQHRIVCAGASTKTMSDDALIRRENLKALGLTAQQLSDKVGARYTYWRDLMAGQKSFGEKAARKIEEKLTLPRGWLDEVHTATKPDRLSPEAMQVAMAYDKMDPVEQQKLRLLFLVARAGIHPDKIRSALTGDASAQPDLLLGGTSGLGELDEAKPEPKRGKK